MQCLWRERWVKAAQQHRLAIGRKGGQESGGHLGATPEKMKKKMAK